MNVSSKDAGHLSDTADVSQYLTFQAGQETLAIAILDVKEIIEIEAITRVPMMPDFICGIINLRGQVVPVIDLARRLGRDASVTTKKSCIVLVEVHHQGSSQFIGMMVDEVNEILEIDEQHTQPPPEFGTDIRTDFIQAMGRVDERFIILLDVNHVLSVSDISALSQVVKQAKAESLTTQDSDSGDASDAS
ncbi:chemotaxis protein CheW [Reinekea blandensis]|uniref:Purine-binding chemotaxis protein CheW n=1 Tax=Reinekea blandensis MED297 TaxID=314283 RepID=A4BD13_9GAMM|nr:chemotaxis protein CheW [Reinekea blandensis]EAR10095.1 purine-binding chemotaxis protein CheW [Reinekea sp. MED297] [Reinekea blandensis MED297]